MLRSLEIEDDDHDEDKEKKERTDEQNPDVTNELV
jgi:hypothetical protein